MRISALSVRIPAHICAESAHSSAVFCAEMRKLRVSAHYLCANRAQDVRVSAHNLRICAFQR
jgi:hypothetical protein